YADPSVRFRCYVGSVGFADARPLPISVRDARHFRFDPEEFQALGSNRTRLIIVNSPHNPTGSVFTRADLEVIADVARDRDIVVLSDEIYSRLLYSGQHESIATLDDMLDRTILLDGWSKTWAMTGWRLGFGVFPAELVP